MSIAGQAPADTISERAARSERWVVLCALATVVLLGLWATLYAGEVLMPPAPPTPDAAAYAVLLFIMWWAMMLAMMLPSAAPAILAYAAMSRRFAGKGAPHGPVAVFVAGYAAIWTLFSLAAVALQVLTSEAIPLTGMMALTSAAVGGGLLMAAGIYQLTPLKYACLRKCQAPLMFFAHNWRNGAAGAFHMGFSHGIYCLGCCWVLMGLLFYGGVMEPRWIVGLALYVAVEKLIPAGDRLVRFTGILLVGWGLWVLYRALS